MDEPSDSNTPTMSDLPLLLPSSVIPQPSVIPHLEWKPTKYLSEPQPPPQDTGQIPEGQVIDGKIIKKTRPRRTVDYNGGVGRWALVRRTCMLLRRRIQFALAQLKKLRPNPYFVPHMRPAPPFIIDVSRCSLGRSWLLRYCHFSAPTSESIP